MKPNIAFLGGGNMCEAMIKGLLTTGFCEKNQLFVTDINDDRLGYLSKEYGISTIPSKQGEGAKEIILKCSIIIIAVKPSGAAELLKPLTSDNGALCVSRQKTKETTDDFVSPYIISIMGGVTLQTLGELLPGVAVTRCMPNTSLQVGKGCCSLCHNASVTLQQKQFSKNFFGAMGTVFELPEQQIDAFTGIAGCGPAFVYMFMEALADAGCELGLSLTVARTAAAATVCGAAETALSTVLSFGELKEKVCSPGGATIAGVQSLESDGFKGTVMNAVTASAKRMKQVGESSSK